MNVILVDSGAFPHGFMGTWYRSAPIGLLSLAGAVRDIADKITIFDDRLPNRKQLEKTDVLGIRVMTPHTVNAMNFFQEAKRVNPDIKTVMGGFHATIHKQGIDEDIVDHIVLREGEISFRKILLGETTEKYVESPLIENLDDLPFPAYDLINPLNYHSFGVKAIMLESSRGCPYKCTFCNVRSFFKDTYRFKSIPRVIAEIEKYTKRHQVSINFIDDNHTANVKRAMRLCDTIIDNGLDHILYFCQSRVDTLARHPELVKRMAEAGYYTIFIGVESPYQASLDEMNKNQTWEEAKKAIHLLNDYGIHSYVSMVMGSPNETEVMVKQYPKFVQELQASFVHFCILTYFPNTDAYNEITSEMPILLEDLEYYDAGVCTFKHPRIDSRRLNELLVENHLEYYSNIENYIPTVKRIFKLLNRIMPKRAKKRLRDYLTFLMQGNLLKSGQSMLDGLFNTASDLHDIFRAFDTLSKMMLSQGRNMLQHQYVEEINKKITEKLKEMEREGVKQICQVSGV